MTIYPILSYTQNLVVFLLLGDSPAS